MTGSKVRLISLLRLQRRGWTTHLALHFTPLGVFTEIRPLWMDRSHTGFCSWSNIRWISVLYSMYIYIQFPSSGHSCWDLQIVEFHGTSDVSICRTSLSPQHLLDGSHHIFLVRGKVFLSFKGCSQNLCHEVVKRYQIVKSSRLLNWRLQIRFQKQKKIPEFLHKDTRTWNKIPSTHCLYMLTHS